VDVACSCQFCFSSLVHFGSKVRIWGQEEATGKGVGEDILSKKKSLPVVYALEKADGELREIYSRESITLRDVRTVMRRLDDLGAREYAHSTATQHWRLAHDALNKTGIDNPAQRRLRELALFLIERRH
jgi:geranylgeranyl diphosphate synthase type I